MKGSREKVWRIFLRNREAVIAALKRGECDGILPAARGFLDGFAEFCLNAGVLECFERFPDRRARRTIPIFFFCNTLVHRLLFHLTRLAPIAEVLFRSPYILRQLGFNARQIEEGFYQTPDSQRPFTAQTIGDCFAKSKAEDFLTNQMAVLDALKDYCPGEFLSGLWVMDSVHIHVPRGAHTPAQDFKACVLGVWQESVVWPLLWAFVPDTEHESTVGKKVFAAAEEVLGEGTIRHLLVDRGYLDGQWLTELYERGTRVTIGVREDMLIMEELMNWARAPDPAWERVDPPKLHQDPLPQRHILGIQHLEGEWSTCEAPLSGCLIRDTYPEEVRYQALVTTAADAAAGEIIDDNGCRWTLEEIYMTLTRYWELDDLPPCRLGIAYAMVHFGLLAFTLLGFYLQEYDLALNVETWNTGPPPIPLPERELAVYAGPYFALLLPSELMEIVLSHIDVWQANRRQLILALRLCEGNT
jgi:hypothetical protein